jgi:hypothetical protein
VNYKKKATQTEENDSLRSHGIHSTLNEEVVLSVCKTKEMYDVTFRLEDIKKYWIKNVEW